MTQTVTPALLVEPLSDPQLLRFIVQLGVLLISARLMGELFTRLGQPPIIGELLAGILIGPTRSWEACSRGSTGQSSRRETGADNIYWKRSPGSA